MFLSSVHAFFLSSIYQFMQKFMQKFMHKFNAKPDDHVQHDLRVMYFN